MNSKNGLHIFKFGNLINLNNECICGLCIAVHKIEMVDPKMNRTGINSKVIIINTNVCDTQHTHTTQYNVEHDAYNVNRMREQI